MRLAATSAGPRNRRAGRLVCAVCSWLALFAAAPAFSQSFTAAQAERGGAIYQERCAACHGEDVQGDGNGVTPALFGPVFEGNWGGLPIGVLLDRIRQESQQSKPAGLSRPQQADVLAFLLRMNGVAPGAAELPADPAALSTKLSALRATTQGASYPPAFPRKNATPIVETDRFTVWDIVWPKGEPTPLHRHLYDQVGTYYQAGGRRITTPDGEARLAATELGALSNTRAGTTHIEEGTTDPPLRAVFIELKKVPSAGPPAPGALDLSPGQAKPVMSDERVNAVDFTPPPGARFTVSAARDTVVIWLLSGKTWYLPRGTVRSATADDTTGRAIVFEIK